jgi:hypothetical protein
VRDAERLRNSWAERAEKEGIVIVAPLWPGTLDVSKYEREIDVRS